MQRAAFEGIITGDDSLLTTLYMHVHLDCIHAQRFLQQLWTKNEGLMHAAPSQLSKSCAARTHMSETSRSSGKAEWELRWPWAVVDEDRAEVMNHFLMS
jgi:hypothetical protein